jgi:hypothetical protein
MDYDGETYDLPRYEEQDSVSTATYRGAINPIENHFSSLALGIPRMKALVTPDEGYQPQFNAIFSEEATISAPQPPVWVQPYTSFTLQDDAVSIMQRFATFMRELQSLTIDYHCESHYAMRGIIYHPSDKRSATFRLSIYQQPPSEDGKTMHLVEANRLDGDSIIFRSFYDELENHLNEEKALNEGFENIWKSTAKSTPELIPPFTWDFSMEPMADVDTDLTVNSELPMEPMEPEHVASIVQLASSPKVDQAREGMALLASCAAVTTNQQELLATPFLQHVLNKTLSSPDAEIARFASLCLLNLLEQGSQQAAIELAKALTGCLVKILCEKERLETLETNRQAATCLLKLAVGGFLVDADLGEIFTCSREDVATEACLNQVRVGIQV